jgi:hypothetical protein
VIVRGDSRCGFVAAYDSGQEKVGASLMDILTAV